MRVGVVGGEPASAEQQAALGEYFGQLFGQVGERVEVHHCADAGAVEDAVGIAASHRAHCRKNVVVVAYPSRGSSEKAVAQSDVVHLRGGSRTQHALMVSRVDVLVAVSPTSDLPPQGRIRASCGFAKGKIPIQDIYPNGAVRSWP